MSASVLQREFLRSLRHYRMARPPAPAIALAALAAILGPGTPAPAQAAPVAIATPAAPGEILVGFRAGASPTQRRHALERAGTRAKKQFRRIDAVLASVRGDSRSAIERLERNPLVRYAEPNYVLSADNHGDTPNDPAFHQLWGLDNFGQVVSLLPGTPDADIDAKEAWEVTTGSSSVVVAVIDTGIDLGHPDLTDNVWVNSGENCAGCRSDGVDNDHNGYVDDWHGWDFKGGDNDPDDDNGHGTHVAGTIGAVGNNGVGVTGVNWTVRLMALKILGADGSGTTADAISAVLYAADQGAAVLNNSYGGDSFSQAFADAIAAADAGGSLFVAAAGNDATNRDTSPTYPASYALPNVVSVAATDNRDGLAWFSAYGRLSVALGAPGMDVYSTWPDNAYAYASGTSMAAPHVSGAAALAKAAFPAASGVGLEALLLRTVDAKPSLAGRTRTGGRLNVDRAVRCAGPQAWVVSPQPGFVAEVGEPVAVTVIAARCGDPSGTAVSASANGAGITLTGRGDGLYRGIYTPPAEGTLRIQATADAGGASDTQTVTGFVPVPIVAGGPPVVVGVANAGDDALLRFSGEAGRRVSLKVGPSCCQATVTIKKPDGSTLASAVTSSSGGFIDTKTLTQSGAYTILVDAAGTATGNITLQLYDVPPDVSGPIVPGGDPVTVTIGTPGQNALLTFSGQSGQRVFLQGSGNTIPSCTSLALLKPGGLQPSATSSVCGPNGYLDTQTLQTSGTFTVAVNPSAASTGSLTLTLHAVPPDITGPIVPGGSAVTVSTTTPGQNALLSFSGQGGKRVSLKLGPSCCQATVSIKNPDGSTLVSALILPSGGFIDTKALVQSGTYTILVDPTSTATGDVTVQLYDVPPDVSGAIVVGGGPVTVTVTAPGQNAVLSFEGQAGQKVTLAVGPTCCQTKVAVKNPDGSTLVSTVFGTGGGSIAGRTLLQTGTHTILVDPQSTATGSVTLRLSPA